MLKTAIPTECNLSRQEREALLWLHANKNLIADKGNAIVLLDSGSYHSKVMAILQDNAFHQLAKDPTSKIERTLTRLIKNTDRQTWLRPP